MINKLKVISILNKYYLGENESVRWVINNKELTIKFESPSGGVRGVITCSDFDLDDSELAIYETKKLQNLISICNGDLILKIEHLNKIPLKLHISDNNFNLIYPLSDLRLISNKKGSINIPVWDAVLKLELQDLDNIVKAKNAIPGDCELKITASWDEDKNPICEFVLGENYNHSTKVIYGIRGDIKDMGINLLLDADYFKSIFQANKDMERGSLFISKEGLIKIEFNSGNIKSEYFMVSRIS